VEIRHKMFFRYIVAKIPNRTVHDVLRHAGARVCLLLANSSSPASQSSDFQQRLPKTDAWSTQIRLRCRLSAPVGFLPVKISTRIPVLSP
jgi:hypothetical protein